MSTGPHYLTGSLVDDGSAPCPRVSAWVGFALFLAAVFIWELDTLGGFHSLETSWPALYAFITSRELTITLGMIGTGALVLAAHKQSPR
jgi:hypothetical protein